MSENLDICKEFLANAFEHSDWKHKACPSGKDAWRRLFCKRNPPWVFVKDETDRSYDIEMQVIGKNHLSLRARYYQSVLDISSLHAGDDYESLAESYVIFLCLEDIFHKGLPIYTFKSVYSEDNGLFLNDKTTEVFCNAIKYNKMPVEKLRTFFKFLVEKKPDETEFSKTLSEKVLKAKITEDARRTYITLEQEIRLAAKHAAQEAFEEEYKKASENEKLENSRKMKAKNIPDDIISKCTGLSLQQVQEL